MRPYAPLRIPSDFVRNNCYLVYLLYISDGVWNTLALILIFSIFSNTPSRSIHNEHILSFKCKSILFDLLSCNPFFLQSFAIFSIPDLCKRRLCGFFQTVFFSCAPHLKFRITAGSFPGFLGSSITSYLPKPLSRLDFT